MTDAGHSGSRGGWRVAGHLALTAFLALVVIEGMLRLVLGSPLSYDETLEQTLGSHERLFPANTRKTYDVRGLYEGGQSVELRVSQRRLIEPDPGTDAPAQRVLFLGGSTTEALYLPEAERWVARLNQPGLATFNGGQSGANLIDQIGTLGYLTAREGLRPTLVVVTTAMNDFVWQIRLASRGGFTQSAYYDALRSWMVEQRPQHRWSLRELVRYSVLAERVGRVLRTPAAAQAPVVELYRQERADATRRYRREVSLQECPAVLQALAVFRSNQASLFQTLVAHVQSLGAGLMVMSEATAFLAPAGSFHEDFRTPFPCADDVALSMSDSDRVLQEANRAYLGAASEAGATTFDMAETMRPLTNGPMGGRYMYDVVHYTPHGAAEVAARLQPVLGRLAAVPASKAP